MPAAEDPTPEQWADPARSWSESAVALGAGTEDAVRDGADLAARYTEPHRRYHGTEHVRAVLRDSAWLAQQLQLPPRERHLLVLAACAHDVVHAGRPGADERDSADWAERRLTESGVGAGDVERVRSLVLATTEHVADAGDLIADALLDADLAILGAPAPTYRAYVDAVRSEYPVAARDWARGRSAVLRALLERPEIYRSEPARARWDGLARQNLRTELRGLHTR